MQRGICDTEYFFFVQAEIGSCQISRFRPVCITVTEHELPCLEITLLDYLAVDIFSTPRDR